MYGLREVGRVQAFCRGLYRRADAEPVDLDLLALEESTSIGLCDAPRSIIDAFRMRATEGHELGYEALRRWLRTTGSQPGQLIRPARQFPKAETLRTAMAGLL